MPLQALFYVACRGIKFSWEKYNAFFKSWHEVCLYKFKSLQDLIFLPRGTLIGALFLPKTCAKSLHNKVFSVVF